MSALGQGFTDQTPTGHPICPECKSPYYFGHRESCSHYPHTRPQVDPKPGKDSVTEAVLADLQARRAMGQKKYGTELKTYNGRDPLIDAYQEALDLCLYLKQAIMERKSGL